MARAKRNGSHEWEFVEASVAEHVDRTAAEACRCRPFLKELSVAFWPDLFWHSYGDEVEWERQVDEAWKVSPELAAFREELGAFGFLAPTMFGEGPWREFALHVGISPPQQMTLRWMTGILLPHAKRWFHRRRSNHVAANRRIFVLRGEAAEATACGILAGMAEAGVLLAPEGAEAHSVYREPRPSRADDLVEAWATWQAKHPDAAGSQRERMAQCIREFNKKHKNRGVWEGKAATVAMLTNRIKYLKRHASGQNGEPHAENES